MKKIISMIFIVILMLSAVLFAGMTAIYATEYNTPEIATWSGFRKGAASFTFDDGAPSHIEYGGPLFEKYKYRATFCLVVNWNPDWGGFQNLADKGHEIASHSNSHGQNMRGEEASSKENIESHITQKYGCITVAYPNLTVPDQDAVRQNYIAGRIGNGSWAGEEDIMGKDGPSDWTKVSALMTGNTYGINTADGFIGCMEDAINKNGWVAFLSHGFQGKNNGSATYSPTDLDAIEGALKWAQQNDKDIWIAPLGYVAMYIKERNASRVKQTGSSDSSVTFTLTHSIADSVSAYNYPLSLRMKLPGTWSKANAYQNGAVLQTKLDGGWLYFDAVPNAGDIVVERKGKPAQISIEGAEVVLSAASFTYNRKEHKPSVKTIGGEALTLGTDYTLAITDSKGAVVTSPKAAGTYTVAVTGTGDYNGSTEAKFVISKAKNPLKVKAKTATVKYSKIKKKAQKLAVKKVIRFFKNGQGSMTYTLTSVKKGGKSFKKKFTINKKTGKVTVKKGLKKGKYIVKIKVKAAGNANYKKSAVKTVSSTVKVK